MRKKLTFAGVLALVVLIGLLVGQPISPVKLFDTNYVYRLTLLWNEAGGANYDLNFKVNAASRTIDLGGNLTLTGANTVSTWTDSGLTQNYVLIAGAAGLISNEQYLAVSRGGTNKGSWTQYSIPYASAATTISEIAPVASAVLVTDGSKVPSESTDIPTAVTIGSAYIYRASGTDVAVADGGTNISSYAVGDLLYASAGTTLSKLADVAVGSYLRSGGVTTAPLWSTLTLPNSATQGDILYASGANAIGNLADVAVGSYMRSGGVGANPLWSTLILPNSATQGDTVVATGANTWGAVAASTAGKIYRAAGAGTVPAWSTAQYPDTATTTGAYMRADGTNWIMSTLVLPNAATANQVVYATASNTWGAGTGLTYDGTSLLVNSHITTPGSTNLTIDPTGDIYTSPAGSDVLPGTAYAINIGALTNKYLALHVAELWAENLVAQNTIATIGGRILVGPTTELVEAAASGDTHIHVKHNEMASGDRVYLEANGAVEFMAITSGASGGAGNYSYNVTRNLDGSGANDWAAGDAVFNTGAAGEGFIDLYSVHGVKAGTEYGPTIVGNIRNSTTYNDWSPRWAVGNLDGLYDYVGTTYGFAAGKYTTTWVSVDETNGFRIMNGASEKLHINTSGVAEFVSSYVTIDANGIRVTPSAAAATLTNGYTFTTATSNTFGLFGARVPGTSAQKIFLNSDVPNADAYTGAEVIIQAEKVSGVNTWRDQIDMNVTSSGTATMTFSVLDSSSTSEYFYFTGGMVQIQSGYPLLIGATAKVGSESLRVDGDVYIDHDFKVVRGAGSGSPTAGFLYTDIANKTVYVDFDSYTGILQLNGKIVQSGSSNINTFAGKVLINTGSAVASEKLLVYGAHNYGTVEDFFRVSVDQNGGVSSNPMYYGSIALSGQGYDWGAIRTIQTNPSSSWTNRMAFFTMDGGGGSLLERMAIDNSGNVGVGTSAPGAKFTIIKDSPYNTGAVGLRIQENTTGNYYELWVGSSSSGYSTIQSYRESSGTAKLLLNPIGGGVIVNTTVLAGSESFRVNGTSYFDDTIRAGATGGNYGLLLIPSGGGTDWGLYIENNDFVIREYGVADRFKILDGGNTLINMASAGAVGAKFESTGAANQYAGCFYGSTTHDQSAGLYVQAGSTSSDYNFVAVDHAAGSIMYLRGDGYGYLNATGWNFGPSNRRFKENIRPVVSALALIGQLKPATYDYIGGKKGQVGFIAEEIKAVLPSLVYDEKGGFNSIRTTDLIPYLVRAIQEQQAQIDELKAKVARLSSNN